MGQDKIAQKPHLLKLSQSTGSSFILKGDSIAWNNPWHFHPEIELLYCIRGKGTNYVGNYIAPICEGEVLLFGRNLPHTRQRDRDYYNAQPDAQPETIVVQFREDFLGEAIFSMPEFQHIGKLLENAQRGIAFLGATRSSIAERLSELNRYSGSDAIIRLLGLLNEMGRSTELSFLNHSRYPIELNDKDTLRINQVFNYVHEHFREHISLSDIAGVANLSPAAFCRYFKTRTRNSFVDYVNQIRVEYARELLMEGRLDITQVSFSSGFNNLSNFNKQFKKMAGETPSQYRAKALNKINRFATAGG
jgi:AraC-like DNA-binding protein